MRKNSSSSSEATDMAKPTISIRRILLGMVFVALPFSAFGGFGPQGIIVAAIIAVAMFTACCIASRDQLQSMFGIIACTTVGLFIGTLFMPTFTRHYNSTNYLIFFGSIGCFIGILWSEHFYSVKMREQASVKEGKNSQKDNGHTESTADDNSIEL